MGSRLCFLERKVVLTFAVAAVVLALIGARRLGCRFQSVDCFAGHPGRSGHGEATRHQRQARRDCRIERHAIISKTLDGIITSWNPAAVRLFGSTATEAIASSMLRVISLERAREEVEILVRIRSGQRIDHFKTRRVRKVGTLIDVAVTISPVRDRMEESSAPPKIARDITEPEQVEDEIRQHANLLSLALR